MTLNGGTGWEAANIPSRVGIVNTASEYWRGGPFRLKNPDYARRAARSLTSTAAAALDYWGFRVYADADPLDWQAQSLAFGLWDAAFWLWNFDEFWCRATSDDRPIWSGHCLPNDGFVPTWSQFYPGATVNFEVNGGPVHTRGDAAVRRVHLRGAHQLHARAAAGRDRRPRPLRRRPVRHPAAPGPATRAARRRRQPLARSSALSGPVDQRRAMGGST